MLSKKAKYGLKAMIYLAQKPIDLPISIQEIAECQRISKKFLDAILLQLRMEGLLQSRRGKGGGYLLARPAKEICVGDIIRVLDGPIAPISCASKYAFQPCDDCDVDACRVRKLMIKVRDAMSDVLDRTNLDEVVKYNHLPIHDWVI